MPIPCRPNRCLAALAAALLVSLPAAAQKPAAPPPKFDDYVAGVLRTFTVPGVAVAIVKDGKVVMAKGYGVRRLGDPAPVDARTQFGIASNTQGLHRHGARDAGRGGQGRVGRAGHPVPAVVRDVRPVRHPRAHRARPARAPERPRARRRRPAVVAAVDLRPEGDRAATALHRAGDVVPERVRLRQRALSRGRRGHRGGLGTDLGGVRAAPASWPGSG